MSNVPGLFIAHVVTSCVITLCLDPHLCAVYGVVWAVYVLSVHEGTYAVGRYHIACVICLCFACCSCSPADICHAYIHRCTAHLEVSDLVV